MVSLEKERLELLSDIHKLGYESLRYSMIIDQGSGKQE